MSFLSSCLLLRCRRHRRKRVNIIVTMELVLMILNLTAFIFPNAYLLACKCCTGFYTAIGWSAFVRWSCWNMVRFDAELMNTSKNLLSPPPTPPKRVGLE